MTLFEQNLMRFKEELRDLKTAHQRGLGTTRFYKYELEISAQPINDYTFKANIADGEPERPIITPYISIGAPIQGVEVSIVSSGTTSTTFQVFTGFNTPSGPLKVGIISSSMIKEFVKI